MDILDRIQYLMKLNNLSASAFADKIEIQRSSMSHLLSGRNKPSLDFVNKVLIAFPKINADWLLNGKKEIENVIVNNASKLEEHSSPQDSNTTTPTLPINNNKQIKKVVIFYTDNTFEEITKN
jgi:transcriptional regulator with XRE-family HTH domain